MGPAAANGTLINSDYPLDKIVYLLETPFTVNPGNVEFSVPHNLPFTPLLKAVWSTDPGFSVTYNIGDGVPDSNPLIVFSTIGTDVSATSTNARVYFIRNAPTSQVVYIRIWGYMPSNINDIVPPTAISGDKFVVNSDYNYTKLFMAGVTSSSSTPGLATSVDHNLGYYPQNDVWAVHDGATFSLSYTQVLFGLPDTGGTVVTPTSLAMYRTFYPSSAWSFHYRIYMDEL